MRGEFVSREGLALEPSANNVRALSTSGATQRVKQEGALPLASFSFDDPSGRISFIRFLGLILGALRCDRTELLCITGAFGRARR